MQQCSSINVLEANSVTILPNMCTVYIVAFANYTVFFILQCHRHANNESIRLFATGESLLLVAKCYFPWEGII